EHLVDREDIVVGVHRRRDDAHRRSQRTRRREDTAAEEVAAGKAQRADTDADEPRQRPVVGWLDELTGDEAGGAPAEHQDPSRRRSPRMLSKNDEKKICSPTISSSKATIARLLWPSAPKLWLIHWITITSAVTKPARVIAPPSARPCSSRKRARILSNQASFSPMK